MEIVSNNMFLKCLKSISLFKLDLGSNIKGPVPMKPQHNEPKIKILDEFVKKYQTLTNNMIFKYGEIGTLKFYEDNKVSTNEIHVYDNEKIYEITVDINEMKINATSYLTSILKLIDSGEVENTNTEQENIVKNITYTNMPENLQRPSLKMPKDEYIRALIERRRFLENIK